MKEREKGNEKDMKKERGKEGVEVLVGVGRCCRGEYAESGKEVKECGGKARMFQIFPTTTTTTAIFVPFLSSNSFTPCALSLRKSQMPLCVCVQI